MTKFIKVIMPNGEAWEVPAVIILTDRAKTLAEVDSKNEPEIYQKVYDEEYKNAFNDNDLIVEWARKNFNWSDVESMAFKSAPAPQLTRKQKEEAWTNGSMTVVTKV